MTVPPPNGPSHTARAVSTAGSASHSTPTKTGSIRASVGRVSGFDYQDLGGNFYPGSIQGGNGPKRPAYVVGEGADAKTIDETLKALGADWVKEIFPSGTVLVMRHHLRLAHADAKTAAKPTTSFKQQGSGDIAQSGFHADVPGLSHLVDGRKV